MSDNELLKYFNKTTGIIQAYYERTKGISNSSLKGKEREIFIENFLEKCFPKKFVIGTGEIIDSSNKKSKQCDVIVYDEHMPIFDYGPTNSSTKMFLSGGVLLHIEIKSKLTKGELEKSINITDSIKSLNRDIDAFMHTGDLPKEIYSCLFAYENEISTETFKSLVSSSKIDHVCILNNLNYIKAQNQILETKEQSLFIFFLDMFNHMYKSWSGFPNLLKYAPDLTSMRFKIL